MKLKTKHYCSADFIYSKSTYSGVLEGRPDVSHNSWFIDGFRKKAEMLSDAKFYFHDEHKYKTELLPGRGNIALASDSDKMLLIMWFDRGELDAREALANIIDSINWNKLAEEYCF